MDVGTRIKTLRQLNKMSQKELADLLGVSRQRVIAWEQGHSDVPEDKKVAIRDIFGVEIDLFDPGVVVEVKRVSGEPGAEGKYTLAKVSEESVKIYEFDLNKMRSLVQELTEKIPSLEDPLDLETLKFWLSLVVDKTDARIEELKTSEENSHDKEEEK